MAKKPKLLIIVLDGAGDRPHPLLDNKTPLAYAQTPTLDQIARSGVVGLLDVIGNGRIPVSSSGAISILGYDPLEYYPGETMLEALGIEDSRIREGDVVVHASFATGAVNTQILDRRVCRDLTADEAQQLANDITDRVRLRKLPVEIRLLNYRYYRNVLVISRTDGGRLSDRISNTDPAHKKDGYFDVPNVGYEMRVLPCQPLENSAEARFTAAAVNEFIKETSKFLSEHPINVTRRAELRPEANLIITRNASGQKPDLPTFGEVLGAIVETPGEKAVAQLLGARLIHFSFLTEPSPRFYKELTEIVLRSLDQVDVLYVHTKGPDEPGHDGNPVEKVRVIEMIDAEFLKRLLSKIVLNETALIVTSDHATPCELKVHSADPVPLAVVKPGWRPDPVNEFSEGACSLGALGKLLGKELLGLVRA